MFKIDSNVRPLGNSMGMIIPSVVIKAFKLNDKDLLHVIPTKDGFEVKVAKLEKGDVK